MLMGQICICHLGGNMSSSRKIASINWCLSQAQSGKWLYGRQHVNGMGTITAAARECAAGAQLYATVTSKLVNEELAIIRA